MPKLISHRPHPPLPCAPTKRWSQICSVDCLGSPTTRDHRSRGRSRDILPGGRSTRTQHDVHPLLGRVPQFRTPSPPKCALSISTIWYLDALRHWITVQRCSSHPTRWLGWWRGLRSCAGCQPPPQSRPRMVVWNKNSKPKLILDHNFMWFLCSHTFDHEPFQRGKQDMCQITKMEWFDTNFHMQLHINYLATWTTRKQKQAINATCASHLRDADLDALLENTSILPVISSKWREFSCLLCSGGHFGLPHW